MNALRIFAHRPLRTSLRRPNQPPTIAIALLDEPTTEDEVVVEDEPPTPIERIPTAIEQQIVTILTSAPMFGETIDATFRRKERELGDAFARLTLLDARALQRRLEHPLAEDRVAARFGRLVVERRTRLLAILAARR